MRLSATGADHSPAIEKSVSGESSYEKAKLYANSDSYRNGQPDGRLVSQPKLYALFKPAEGWMVLVLLMIALYSVVVSIRVVNWVDYSNFLLWMPMCGLL